MYEIEDIRNCPALVNLIVAASEQRTTCSKVLAKVLRKSRHTIDNQWITIRNHYQADSRLEAFWAAVADGVAPPMSAAPRERERERERDVSRRPES